MTASATTAAQETLRRSTVEELARDVGPSFYLLDLDRIRESHDELLGAFRRRHDGTVLAYSVKTHSTPRVLALIRELGSLAEVVSELEYDIATRTGFEAGEIVVNGPVHSADFLRDVVLQGVRINLDGWYMLDALHELSRAHPRRELRVGLRLCYPIPGAEWSRFGFEVTPANMGRLAEWFRAHGNCRVVGLHSHFPLAPPTLETFRGRTRGLVDAARTWFPDALLEYLDVGGGIRPPPQGPPYADLADAVARVAEELGGDGPRPALIIEPGNALVSGAMAFVCPVVDVKQVEGRTLALVDGSNHSINTMLWHQDLRIDVLPAAGRPETPGSGSEPREPETFGLIGNTCMERKDLICASVPGSIARGDYVVFHAVGAYSIGLKPPFIHPCPAVVARQGDRYEVVKRRETVDDVLATFCQRDVSESTQRIENKNLLYPEGVARVAR